MKNAAYPNEKKLCGLALVLDVSPRWNSTYVMLERAAELQLAIDLFIASDS